MELARGLIDMSRNKNRKEWSRKRETRPKFTEINRSNFLFSLPGSSPSLLRASGQLKPLKLSSSGWRFGIKHRRAERAASRVGARARVCSSKAARPLCGRGRFSSPSHQTHLLSGARPRLSHSGDDFWCGRMEIDHLLSAPRLYERTITCGSASCSQSQRSSGGWTKEAANQRVEADGGGGGSHWKALPPFLSIPRPEEAKENMETLQRPERAEHGTGSDPQKKSGFGEILVKTSGLLIQT